MLKACPYCGKIHMVGEVCERKPIKKKFVYNSRNDKFHWSQAWRNKRKVILDRDYHCCKCCLPFMNSKSLEVHHIESLNQDYEKRLDDDNLITLCSYHHHLADIGAISPEKLKKLIKTTPHDYF